MVLQLLSQTGKTTTVELYPVLNHPRRVIPPTNTSQGNSQEYPPHCTLIILTGHPMQLIHPQSRHIFVGFGRNCLSSRQVRLPEQAQVLLVVCRPRKMHRAVLLWAVPAPWDDVRGRCWWLGSPRWYRARSPRSGDSASGIAHTPGAEDHTGPC